MKEYIAPIIDIWWQTEDILTASGESGIPDIPDKTAPDTFAITQPAKESVMARHILNLNNAYRYLSLRKLGYKKFLRIYSRGGFIDFELDPDNGVLEWKIELPWEFIVSSDETIGELIERMKAIDSSSLKWHCSWLHNKLIDNSDILPDLYVPVLTDDDITDSYVAVPSLSSIETWLDYCNFIEELITACNAIDMPMSYLQTNMTTYSIPIPVYTQSPNADGTDTYEFFTNILLTVREV